MGFRSVLFILVVCAVMLPGMGYANEQGEDVHVLYEKARGLFSNKKYKDTIAVLEKIEALYPFSQIAIDGSLMAAEANYELGNYREAAALADSYIGVYPNSDVVDYAYYIRLASKYMLIPDLGLDQTEANEVLEQTSEFVKMFPDSKYIESVVKRQQDVRKHLAAKELLIGRYYLKRGEYIAAIKRFAYLLAEYPDSVYATESRVRMAEAYEAIGEVHDSDQGHVGIVREYADNAMGGGRHPVVGGGRHPVVQES
ncbi:outer membrane protein assembly factor BamD [Candidatus Anaplasma sp. TIGMIC]|uniref:outer membrane protein assembly factor BamD n=1 Tax=Candidatus Anaplasma sp. TIGMIC TaxID=3020713 RepID=UPI00232E421C|nr:outer membrane protein assembly factor BamD [Candidatus Anaplasma sp. TIGMIC]MDB1135524.1 outer membrane protein assembly factor BamD [Candidatus Anaplasma sp. TIGMIC]